MKFIHTKKKREESPEKRGSPSNLEVQRRKMDRHRLSAKSNFWIFERLLDNGDTVKTESAKITIMVVCSRNMASLKKF